MAATIASQAASQGAPKTSLWLRCETKEFEARAALTPTTAKALLDAGFEVIVERDPQRIFEDIEYENVGCVLAPHSSWPEAPRDTIIIGLKELPEGDSALPHTHIQFAHCYKEQGGWAEVLARFTKASPPGTLYDIEFLQEPNGRRVAAFGFHAGFAGAAVGVLALDEQSRGKRLGGLKPYPNEGELVKEVRAKVKSMESQLGRSVRALVIGALGRCGRGAVDLFQKAGIDDSNIIKWDMAETAKGGPFPELLDVDIFVNCIYLTSKIPSFLTEEFIKQAGTKRNLGVVVDVSCDTTNPNNPLPIYSINTTFDKPTVDVELGSPELPMTMVSIDHLPTLLPREASEAFSADLLPSLMELPNRKQARVWTEVEALYHKKAAEAQVYLEQNGKSV